MNRTAMNTAEQIPLKKFFELKQKNSARHGDTYL